MPSALIVRLNEDVPGATPRQLLGAAAGVCETAGSDHHAASKSFTAGPVVAEAGGGASWRLGWLADIGFPPGWPPSTVRFGVHTRTVAGFEGHGRSYAELARSGPARRVRLTMTTPTFFSRNGRDLPLPEPVLAVRGLLARWNAHAPAALRVSDDEAKALVGAVFLDDVRGASRKVELGSGLRQVGFEGYAEFRLLKSAPEPTAAVFGALARFAAFAGIGAQTTCGFGVVEVEVGMGSSRVRPPARRPATTEMLSTTEIPAATEMPATAAKPLPRTAVVYGQRR